MILGPAWHTVVSAYTSFIASLPALGLGLVIILVAVILSGWSDQLVSRVVRNTAHEPSLAQALGNIVQFAVVFAGMLVASTVVFPSVKPVDILSFLGLGGVAVGFAFKDIFQNFLAGLLLLFWHPFHAGDTIQVGAYEGVVAEINLRTTVLQTAGGDRVLIPNSDVYSQPVVVRVQAGGREAAA